MTRTDPPDILASTVYQDIKVNSASPHSHSLHSSERCESWKTSTLEDNQENINKRHCRSFDYIESLDDPKSRASSMEHPRRRAERHAVNPDVAWNSLSQQGHLRFSSPDLFNTRLPPQHAGASDPASEAARAELKRKARSKSAPRVKTTFTPVPIEVSSPVLRRGRDSQRGPREVSRKSEASSPRREPPHGAGRAPMNEVHPIKLQPQRGEVNRYSPLYVTDCFDQNRPDKPATSPHVKCRVDIKPDAAVLQHAARRAPASRADMGWQRYHSGVTRSLTVPRQVSTSRTPTPSECYSSEYRYAYQYPNSMPNSYIQPVEIPLQRDPREYLGRERRAFSIPNVPTKFFYTDDPGTYPSPAPSSGTYYQDDHYSIASQNHTPKAVYTQDPRTRLFHTLPVRPYYTEMEPRHFPGHAAYPRPYSTSEPGPYIIQTPPPRAYYREDPRMYPVQPVPSKIFYTNESYTPPPEHHVPVRAYHTEGRRRPRVSQPQVDDWYGSDVSGYAYHHPSTQLTPQRVRTEPVLTPWYANHCMEPPRLGVDTRHYSRSWDNILNPHVERQQPVQRGRSYENLLYQGRRALSPEDRRQPVVVNLSSSPRRYAALSLSETSLLEKGAADGRNSMGRMWFVTPEITITDNDIRPGNLSGKQEVRSASWDALDSRRDPSSSVPYQEPISFAEENTKEKTHNSYSLQQSLEQLDELLADLVIDYKPPASRRHSEDLLDQLKKLINEDEVGPSTEKESKDAEGRGPLNKQPSSTKISPDNLQDLDSGCDGVQKSADECSPDQSTDDDDTMMCSNSKCRRTETLFNACLYFKSCHSCYTYYCSRNCRREDWDVHKESCLYGRIGSICRHVIKFCRETTEIHKAFSRIAKVGYLSRGRGVLFLGFPNPGSSNNFLQFGLESLLMSPTYLSLRELDGFKDNLGSYCRELQEAGNEYDPSECFLLNVSIAVGEQVPDRPSPRVQAPTVRKYAKVSLASSSPERKLLRKESDMETLILTPPPGMTDIDKEGEEGRKAREICFINIQRELRTRGVFLRHEYPQIYQQLCEFVESNKRFTPTTIYPIDKRSGKQFMCMIMAASEPRTLDWVANPHLLDDII
ncbi:apical junction component 1 homolog [Megalops cyprinoides]|uniref:apical junction component 1 homolog n=1 Tax=Megalops cyprinoides TaxID=118141 RepID=UPI001864996D|nr:apical junction component 1 homolog [Megalops cyprinoides]XP_036383916.1 apical junction component 1 homolog [Megalops cyprinoides]XP_036383917.1 apical junction component 1 homolog [Megalops cyprinoides]XP_036383918.1 apical junction component 1 homolog [Megalops cyprinoides]XP_036383919.1 apical junction component 1 homolog [Megalops cyprinoides]XP_036383920.1 apical junction component 1 homolog [Megalops cyprinoides]